MLSNFDIQMWNLNYYLKPKFCGPNSQHIEAEILLLLQTINAQLLLQIYTY